LLTRISGELDAARCPRLGYSCPAIEPQCASGVCRRATPKPSGRDERRQPVVDRIVAFRLMRNAAGRLSAARSGRATGGTVLAFRKRVLASAEPAPKRDRVCLVVGAGSSLGKEIGLVFWQHGYRVVLASERPGVAEREALELTEQGIGASPCTLDVTEADDLLRTLGAIAELGPVGAVVNCAAASSYAPLSDFEGRRARARCVEVGLIGAMNLTSALANLIAAGGSITHISSINATIPVPGYSAYAAAKAGLEMFTKAAAVDLAPLRINCVAPGPLENRASVYEAFPGFLEALRKRHLVAPRLTSPRDVAALALFLASDDACFITGQTLVVDGGVGLNYGNLPNTKELAGRLGGEQ
jgi:NAD(P)-dependent dehydrogenase (short-subunit alcohol dehydrogenase family)